MDGWGAGVGDGKDTAGNTSDLDQAMWATFLKAGGQRSVHSAALCLLLCERLVSAAQEN